MSIDDLPDEILIRICAPLFDFVDLKGSTVNLLRQKDAAIVCRRWQTIFNSYDYMSCEFHLCFDDSYSIDVIDKFKSKIDFSTTFWEHATWQSNNSWKNLQMTSIGIP